MANFTEKHVDFIEYFHDNCMKEISL